MRRGHEKDALGIWVRPDRVPYWESGGWKPAPDAERRAREEMDEVRRRYYRDAVLMQKAPMTEPELAEYLAHRPSVRRG